nr:MAG TPA: hypothetical protein [Caudoviricetes sp.]
MSGVKPLFFVAENKVHNLSTKKYEQNCDFLF